MFKTQWDEFREVVASMIAGLCRVARLKSLPIDASHLSVKWFWDARFHGGGGYGRVGLVALFKFGVGDRVGGKLFFHCLRRRRSRVDLQEVDGLAPALAQCQTSDICY